MGHSAAALLFSKYAVWDQAAVGPSILTMSLLHSSSFLSMPAYIYWALAMSMLWRAGNDVDDTAAGEGDSEPHLVVLWQLLVIINTFFVARRNLTS